MIQRVAGAGRYAQPEREQRWLLSRLPHDLRRPVTIVDHYISGTRLRLRRMQSGADIVYKLAQKVRPHEDSPALVQLTNIYLSDDEYAILSTLGGHQIHKTRWLWADGDRDLAVDEFGGSLTGLLLAEIELQPDERRRPGPPFALAEVTDDDRFSGGRLATTTGPELQAVLAGLGTVAPRPPVP
ncbi:MAG TPA: hypothetical protein VID75_05055 [Acidimicrobiales bacterium]